MELKKNIYLKGNSIYDFLIHLGIVFILTILFVMLFFNAILPYITLHRETVTVPNVVGMNLEELDKFLRDRGLDYVVKDSLNCYTSNAKPYVVLSQSIEPGAKVKMNRKILLDVNPKIPPKVALPNNLLNSPYIEAVATLRNVGLEVGRIKYEPHTATNTVLEVSINGRKFTKESDFKRDTFYIPKGTRIDFLLADGVGEKEFNVPDVVLMPLDEAELVIKGLGLHIGTIAFDFKSSREIGTVVRQSPPVYIGRARPGVKVGSAQDDRERNKVREGDLIDLWVVGNPAAKPQNDEENVETEEELRRKDSLENTGNIRSRDYIKQLEEKKKGTKPTTQKPNTPKTNNQKPNN